MEKFNGKLLILSVQTLLPQNDSVIVVTFKGKVSKQSNLLCKNEDILSSLMSVIYKLYFCLNSTCLSPHTHCCGTISPFLPFPAVEEIDGLQFGIEMKRTFDCRNSQMHIRQVEKRDD